MNKLILLRHGQSQWNLENRFTGWEDVALSKKGIEEAVNAGKLMSKQNIIIDMMSLLLDASSLTTAQKASFTAMKEYIAEIQLGVETDTLDPTGEIVETSNIPYLTEDIIIPVLNEFTGDIEQIPPMYSALKVNGHRLYKLARKGINIDRKMRTINIYEIVLINFTHDTISFNVTCGRGTYIRSLAKDIAAQLNTVGYLRKLIRTRIGEFDENSCVELKDFPKWLSART